MSDFNSLPPISDPKLVEVWTLMGRTLSMYQRIEYALKLVLRVIPQEVHLVSLEPPQVSAKKIEEFKDTFGSLLKRFQEGGFLAAAGDPESVTSFKFDTSVTPSDKVSMSVTWSITMAAEERDAFLALASKVCLERNILAHHFHFRLLREKRHEEAEAVLRGYYDNARSLDERLWPIAIGLTGSPSVQKEAVLNREPSSESK